MGKRMVLNNLQSSNDIIQCLQEKLNVIIIKYSKTILLPYGDQHNHYFKVKKIKEPCPNYVGSTT